MTQSLYKDWSYITGKPNDIQLKLTPSIIGHVEGRLFYDAKWKTVAADINDSVTLQLGQEDVRYVYNNTGSEIGNGKAVYTTGVHTSVDPNLPSVATIALAKADADATSIVLGVTTETIANGSYGFVTIRGHVNDIDTSMMGNAGDVVWLSPDDAGGLTNVKPITPNRAIRVGRLIVSDASIGRLNVRIFSTYSLDDLGDVTVSNPLLDQVIRFNGDTWVNGQPGAISAGAGVDFFFATPVINSATAPAGLSQDGASGNGIQVNSLSKTPITTAEQIQQGYADTDTRAFAAWLYNTPLGKTKIDAGVWQFDSWVSVNSTLAARVSYATRNTYQVSPVSSGSVTITGADANSRTATITSSQFSGTHFAASATNTDASYLQTPTGIYQITAISDANTATITVPTGYTNESGVTFNIWNKLFGVVGGTITSVYPSFTPVTLSSTQPEFAIAATDKLGQISFFTSNKATTFYGTYNGNSRNSRSRTPLVLTHADLAELQGGQSGQYYHLTYAQYTALGGVDGGSF